MTFEDFSKAMRKPFLSLTKTDLEKVSNSNLKSIGREKGVNVKSSLTKKQKIDFFLKIQKELKRLGLKPKNIYEVFDWSSGLENIYVNNYEFANKYVVKKKLDKINIEEKTIWIKGPNKYIIKNGKIKKIQLKKAGTTPVPFYVRTD